MKKIILFFILINVAFVAMSQDKNECRTYSDEWGEVYHQNPNCNSSTIHQHIKFHTCVITTVNSNHICVDNSCHASDCGCSACDNNLNASLAILGFIALILFVFGAFVTKMGLFSFSKQRVIKS